MRGMSDFFHQKQRVLCLSGTNYIGGGQGRIAVADHWPFDIEAAQPDQLGRFIRAQRLGKFNVKLKRGSERGRTTRRNGATE